MIKNLKKLFLIVGVLGVYSASMYTLGSASSEPEITNIPAHSPEDVQKILDVVKVQSSSSETIYVPGVACVIETTQEMSMEEMELLFAECAASHSEHLRAVDFNK